MPEMEEPEVPEGTPRLDSPAFNCPHCGAFSHQIWGSLMATSEKNSIVQFWDGPRFAVTRNVFDSASTISPGGPATNPLPKPQQAGPGLWKEATCSKCRRSSVWRNSRMIYPAGSTISVAHADLPGAAKVLYDEGREVWAISPRAGAALARASLEALLRHLDPGNRNLDERIERMLPKVSDELGDMLTVVRHAGNKSIHPGDEPDDLLVLVLDPEEVEVAELIFATVNDLVEERVTRPAKKKALFDKVPQSVRDRLPARPRDQEQA